VERIAQNLLLNSLKYTQEGYIKVHWNQTSDDQWMLQVSDTGPGLDATHARSLSTCGRSPETEVYDESTTEDKNAASQVVKSHGEGIGLLIVRHLSTLLDAHMDIETESGVGTTITIAFPRTTRG
jgi:signal transduction histidine kinase